MCLLDVDNNEIHLPQEIPTLPNRHELISEMKYFAEKYGIFPFSSKTHPCHSFVEDFLSKSSSLEDVHAVRLNKENISNTGTWPRKHSSPVNEIKKSPHFQTKSNQHVLTECKSTTSRLAAMVALAEKAGVSLPKDEPTETDILPSPDKNMFVLSSRAISLTRTQQHHDEFNIIMREIFLNYFTQMLVDYENFVILPQQTKVDWLNNREHMQNFDKASFLSDQSQPNLPFMTLFVESQGFVSLIDLKIMTLWEDSDPRLAFFDKRIDKLKVKRGIIRSDSYKKCENIPIASKFLY